MVELEEYLSGLIELEVDLVPREGIKPGLEKYILGSGHSMRNLDEFSITS